MGFLWDVYGISMGFLWDFYGISMGFLPFFPSFFPSQPWPSSRVGHCGGPAGGRPAGRAG